MIILLDHREIDAAAINASAGFPNATNKTANTRLESKNLSDNRDEMIGTYFLDDSMQYISKPHGYLRLFCFLLARIVLSAVSVLEWLKKNHRRIHDAGFLGGSV